MNIELYIARKLHFSKDAEKRVSGPAIKIAIAGIAIGIAVMILTIAIVTGFKKEIRNKIIGFGSHVQISNFDNNSSFETRPITISDSLIQYITDINGVEHIQTYATKPGIIKTPSAIEGVVLKGVDTDFDWNFFNNNITRGDTLQLDTAKRNNGIIVSEFMANRLGVDLGDSFICYFFQDKIRGRKFKITGIYKTNFTDFDAVFALIDIGHIRKLNNWTPQQASGLEITIDNFDDLDKVSREIFLTVANKFDSEGNSLRSRSIVQLNNQVFGWLELLDMNVWVILVLMIAVAGFNMVSGLLILILERTNMIGILKSIGTRDWNIRRVFLYLSAFIIGRGMLWGNIIGLLLCAIQYYFKPFSLPPENYYIETVPINLQISHLILLNIGTIIATIVMMILPSHFITKISPSETVRYD